MGFDMSKCVPGCSFYSYHEAYHHKDCGHYEETFSKEYDDLENENNELKLLLRLVKVRLAEAKEGYLKNYNVMQKTIDKALKLK